MSTIEQEERALVALAERNLLTIYRDALTDAAVLLHVHEPYRFWSECVALKMLPTPDASADEESGHFLTQRQGDWGWVQCIYQNEDADEVPWIYRATFPADPVGALYAREVTLVWRMNIPEITLLKMNHTINTVFKPQLTAHPITVTGVDSVPMYLYHAMPLGTEINPYTTLLWYIGLEWLNAREHISVMRRSARGRPITWTTNRLNAHALRAAFPDYFQSAVGPYLNAPTLRHTNWMGLPFLRVDENEKLCSATDLLTASEPFFATPHTITHLPHFHLSQMTTPSQIDLLDDKIFNGNPNAQNEANDEEEEDGSAQPKRPASASGGGPKRKPRTKGLSAS